MTIRIKNLRLRTVIGIYDWEKKEPQDVIINVMFDFDGTRAAETDDIQYTVDYKRMKKRIIHEVESSAFQLIERLAQHILNIVMDDEKVDSARVEVDKPHALRFADSVSVTCSAVRSSP